MTGIKIGICLKSLDLPIRRGMEEASRLAVGGVQIDATGDLAPDRLTDTGRREFRNLLRSYSLELTAVYCPLRHGLDTVENLDARLDHIRAVMKLAGDLGPRRVIIEAGQLPDDESETAITFVSALRDLAMYGDRHGVVLALETGLDPGERLAPYLRRFDSGSLAVNYDPGNLLVNGHDPVTSLSALGELVVHVHATDARRSGTSRAGRDVPLGAGDIDWMGMIGGLEGIEYRGWLVVERRSGTHARQEVADGVRFLRRFVGA